MTSSAECREVIMASSEGLLDLKTLLLMHSAFLFPLCVVSSFNSATSSVVNLFFTAEENGCVA